MKPICLTALSNQLNSLNFSLKRSSLLTYQDDKELKMKCKRFSEHNILLSQVLYALNSNSLTTFACCKGHGSKDGYIAFRVSQEELPLVNELCTSLLRSFPVKVHVQEKRTLFVGLSVGIYFPVKVRTQVLKFMLNRIKNPKKEYSNYMDALFELCRIQESIHDDLMYGLEISHTDYGFIINSQPKFFYYSLSRKISLEQLENICDCMDAFTQRVKDNFFTEEQLFLELQCLNQSILPFATILSDEKRDYYPDASEDELLWMMLELEGYPGYLSNFVERNKRRKLTTHEKEKITRFNLERGLYLRLLKLEESYFAKKEKSLQQRK